MDFHGALHPDLHARVRVDRRGHELAPGAVHHSARQHHRSRSYPAELSPWYEIRHPIPGLRARVVRNSWLERAGADAGRRCLRMVWHPGVDRRASAARLFSLTLALVAGVDSRHVRRSHADGVAVLTAV